MASQPTSGGASFSLFPNPNPSKPRPATRSNNQASRPRRSESHERNVPTPVQQVQDRHAPPPIISSQSQDSSLFSSPDVPSPLSSSPENGRQTPQQRAHTPLEFIPPSAEAAIQPMWDGHRPPTASDEQRQDALGVNYSRVAVQQPRLTIEVPGRTETAFSQAQTLVRSNSGRSTSSIAKLPFPDDPSSSSSQQGALRSIFPTYNPQIPLDQQNYAPTQMSPTRIPRAVISRQSYYEDAQSSQEYPVAYNTGGRLPNRPRDPPAIPKTCTTDQLRDLWKVANGWKASGSEGRVYCLRLKKQKDAPIYLLSSASQPFYNLRIDPTSTSAYVSFSRHDPSKAFKPPKSGSPSSTSSITSSGSGKSTESKHWIEALSTTLEEESRKHRPNDGLVSLLMPSAAVKVAVEKANDPLAVAAAERECARLVWDDDSSSHYLVHPALATPFCVTIEHSPAWSRVEYTLEHHESPQHLAKLTRDGTGGGWLEIDTGIASKIDAFYIIDIAVATLLLVAAADDRNSTASLAETFEAPPIPEPPKQARSTSSRLSRHRDEDGERKKKDKRRPRIEQFELDLESQDSLGKSSKKKKAEDKLPFVIRVFVKLAKGLFQCFIWILTLVFGCFKGVFKVFYSCVGSKY